MHEFRSWVDKGACDLLPDGIDPFIKTIPRAPFKLCLDKWFTLDPVGISMLNQVKKDEEMDEVVAWRQYMRTISIDNPGAQVPDFLSDLSYIHNNYGLGDSFTIERSFIEFEVYPVVMEQTIQMIGFALVCVVLIVLFITMSIRMTVIVVSMVLLVNVFMLGFIKFWGLTLNLIVTVNSGFALGIAVDFSSHIAHTFQSIKAPAHYSNARKRDYKARLAISQMGSSVFHGGFSTLLAICMLSSAKMYLFTVFFKYWFCILAFGMLNGLVAMPIILSIMGPLDANERKRTRHKEGNQIADCET